MDEEEQWIYACISIGVMFTIIIYKFTPLATMVQFGEAGQIIFFGGLAVVVVLATLLVAALVSGARSR